VCECSSTIPIFGLLLLVRVLTYIDVFFDSEGFDVARLGDARVALMGFPSVGKSTLLGALTGTESEAAAYGSF